MSNQLPNLDQRIAEQHITYQTLPEKQSYSADIILAQGPVYVKKNRWGGGSSWKSHFAKIRQSRKNRQYELVLAVEDPAGQPAARSVKGSAKGRKQIMTEVYPLIPNQSSYHETKEFAPQYPFCVQILPCSKQNKKQRAIIVLAVPDEGNFDVWIVALQEATQRQTAAKANVNHIHSQSLLDEQRLVMAREHNDPYDAHLRVALAESLREQQYQQRSWQPQLQGTGSNM